MSHFFLGVIVPPAGVAHFDAHLSERLAPFNENLEVPEYDQECWCVGRVAKLAASEAADKEAGPVDSHRVAFAERHPEFQGADAFSEAAASAWRREVIAPRKAIEKRVLAAHPLRVSPALDCDECAGKGTNRSTSNPQSKWDYWLVGGRYGGAMGGVHPEKNPLNFEPCWLCAGSGRRTDPLGNAQRERDPAYTCNGCDGKGSKLKWPSKWANEGNSARVSDLLARDNDNAIPFAILTPDGRWCERGSMGWFGCVSGEQDDWNTQARALLAGFADHTIVGIDCHI